MSKMTKEVRIGIAFVVALFLLYFGLNFLKGVNIFTPANSYTVAFNNVAGMLIADPVTVNGLKIGQVFEMKLDPDNKDQVLVQIQMDKGVKIPKGSKLALDVGMLSGTNLMLEINDQATEFYEPGDILQGYKKSGLMDVATNLAPKIESFLPKLDSILTGVDKLVNNPALASTLGNVDKMTADFAQSSREINTLLASLNKEMPAMTSKLGNTMDNIEQLSLKASEMDIAATFNKLDSTMANLQHLSAGLASKDSSIGLLLNDRQLYDSLNQTISNMSLLLKDVKENPSRYINVKVF